MQLEGKISVYIIKLFINEYYLVNFNVFYKIILVIISISLTIIAI